MIEYKNIDGRNFGDFQVIGDTGKRSNKGEAIVICRNLRNNKIYETNATSLRRGHTTGYVGSSKHKEIMKARNKNANQNGVHELHINHQNYSTNKTGYRNISYYKSKKCWMFSITVNGKRFQKYFNDFKDAVIYSVDFKIEKFNKQILKPEDKYKDIKRKEIIINDYVKEKQKLINQKGEF